MFLLPVPALWWIFKNELIKERPGNLARAVFRQVPSKISDRKGFQTVFLACRTICKQSLFFFSPGRLWVGRTDRSIWNSFLTFIDKSHPRLLISSMDSDGTFLPLIMEFASEPRSILKGLVPGLLPAPPPSLPFGIPHGHFPMSWWILVVKSFIFRCSSDSPISSEMKHSKWPEDGISSPQ